MPFLSQRRSVVTQYNDRMIELGLILATGKDVHVFAQRSRTVRVVVQTPHLSISSPIRAAFSRAQALEP